MLNDTSGVFGPFGRELATEALAELGILPFDYASKLFVKGTLERLVIFMRRHISLLAPGFNSQKDEIRRKLYSAFSRVFCKTGSLMVFDNVAKKNAKERRRVYVPYTEGWEKMSGEELFGPLYCERRHGAVERVVKDTRWEGGFWGGWRPGMTCGISEFAVPPPPPELEFKQSCGRKSVKRPLSEVEVEDALSLPDGDAALTAMAHSIVPTVALKNKRGRPLVVRTSRRGRPAKVKMNKFVKGFGTV